MGNGLRQEGSPLARDGHDRARRVPDDLAGHQAQQQPGEPSAARADDQQAGILRRVDDSPHIRVGVALRDHIS